MKSDQLLLLPSFKWTLKTAIKESTRFRQIYVVPTIPILVVGADIIGLFPPVTLAESTMSITVDQLLMPILHSNGYLQVIFCWVASSDICKSRCAQ